MAIAIPAATGLLGQFDGIPLAATVERMVLGYRAVVGSIIRPLYQIVPFEIPVTPVTLSVLSLTAVPSLFYLLFQRKKYGPIAPKSEEAFWWALSVAAMYFIGVNFYSVTWINCMVAYLLIAMLAVLSDGVRQLSFPLYAIGFLIAGWVSVIQTDGYAHDFVTHGLMAAARGAFVGIPLLITFIALSRRFRGPAYILAVFGGTVFFNWVAVEGIPQIQSFLDSAGA